MDAPDLRPYTVHFVTPADPVGVGLGHGEVPAWKDGRAPRWVQDPMVGVADGTSGIERLAGRFLLQDEDAAAREATYSLER